MSVTSESDKDRFCYRYPHPAVTADCVIFGFDGEKLKLLLVERGQEPYLGMWALPGGFMKIDETIEQCAQRELMEETGLENVFMTQFKVYSNVNRDPRERVITVAFLALVRQKEVIEVKGGDDARLAAWFDIDTLPPMAFDHSEIITEARARLTEMLRQTPVGFTMLDDIFSMSDIQKVYEAVTGATFDRRNFQRKVIQTNIVKDIGKTRPNPSSRPAKLYTLRDDFWATEGNCMEPDAMMFDQNASRCKDGESAPPDDIKESSEDERDSDSNGFFSLKRWFNF